MNAFASGDFTWFRPRRAGGFAIEVRTLIHNPNRPRAPEPLLTLRTDEVAPYRPLEAETGLFLTFASTDPTPEGVLQFAHRYGRLGKGVEMAFYPGWEDKPGVLQTGESCEPLSEWYRHINALTHWYQVWDAARKGDHQALGRLLNKRLTLQDDPASGSKKRLMVVADPERGLIQAGGDRVELAYHYLADQFSQTMAGLLEPRIVWDESMPRPMPQIVPVSLLGALYLQFAYAVGADKHYQQCAHCAKWFELAPGLNRADRLFCSDSCRVLAYRTRQGQARRLGAEGKTAREIANELGSTVGTVKKWLSKGKQ
jgi:hypothetical protein